MKLKRSGSWFTTVLREVERMGLEIPGSVKEMAEFEWVDELVGKIHDWEEDASRTRAKNNELLPFLHPFTFPPTTALQHLYYISNQSHQKNSPPIHLRPFRPSSWSCSRGEIGRGIEWRGGRELVDMGVERLRMKLT